MVGPIPTKSRLNMIGYAPLLRRGDLTVNAVLFRQSVLGDRSLKRAVKQTRGVVAWRLSLFGQDSESIARLLYGDETLAIRILVENSLFGPYSAGISTQLRAALFQETADWNATAPARGSIAMPEMGRLSASFLRSCCDCVSEDLEDRGFCAWRVIHQVPFIDHCPHHLQPLNEWRDFATSRPSGLVGLPRSGARTASTKEPVRLLAGSDGYAGYLRLWNLIDLDSVPHAAIDQWSAIVTAATQHLGVANLVAAAENAVKERWGLTIAEVGRALGIERNMSARSELSLATRPRDLPRRLVVLDALNHLGMVPARENLPVQRELALQTTIAAPAPAQHPVSVTSRLFQVANNLHMRPSLALALAQNLTVSSALVQAGSPSKSEAYRLIEACPDNLLQEIDGSLPSERTNWARVALRRRILRTMS
jgi:hypothetical protein